MSPFFAVKLGHFTISDFFSICNKTLKLNSENWKTKKKSFMGLATYMIKKTVKISYL